MSKFIIIATIFMLVFPCATSAQEVSSLPNETEDRTYRPEVEFFVDLSETEVAESAFGQFLQSPSGKAALDELRNVEKLMLTVEWSPEKWENFWGSLAGSTVDSGLKAVESLTMYDLSPQATMWVVLENTRLMLIAYTPLATDPDKVRHVNSGFQKGSHLIKIFQDGMQRNLPWSSADDESVHNLVTGYKVVAFSRRGEDQ